MENKLVSANREQPGEAMPETAGLSSRDAACVEGRASRHPDSVAASAEPVLSNGGGNRPRTKGVRAIALMLIRSFFVAVVLVSIGTYVVMAPPVLTTLWPSLILVPPANKEGYDQTVISNRKLTVTRFKNDNGDVLMGWFVPAADPNARVVLYCYGNGGMLPYCRVGIERFLEAGLSVFAFDYRGYGKSEGHSDVRGALGDGEAAYDYLVNELNVPPEKVVLYGLSFGGAVACHLARSKPAGALIVESSFSSLLKVAKKKLWYFQLYPDFLRPVPPLDSEAVLRQRCMPLLIIHGANDQMIPISEAEDNFVSAAGPKKLLVLPNSAHGVDDQDVDTYMQGLRQFLAAFPESSAAR